ncbi:hypothetical protein ES703_120058 [subsurface metagenome]
MSNSYSSLCDDFYLDMYINTELDLPTQRDTILAFFERIQKQFPSMGCFYRRGNNEYCLEENRHDEVIAEALLAQSAFNCLLDLPAAKPISFSPTAVVAISDDCRTQARISVESKTSIYEPGEKRQLTDEAISLSFTIRQYPAGTEKFDALKSFENQCQLAEELMAEKIVPNFVQPLTNVIAQKRLT